MKNALLLLPILAALAGCRSNEDVFRDREMLKLHTEIAQRAYHSGQYDRAVHQARKALEFDPDHPLALVILGYTYLQAARYTADREARLRCLEDGETTLQRAVEHGSERDAAVFKAYFGLGLVYFLWAQEVKGMIRESTGARSPLVIESPEEGSKEDLWNE